MVAESDIAMVVTEAWCSVLDIEVPEADESFFTLGGNSLTSISLIQRLESELGIEFPLEVLFFDGRLSAVIEECRKRSAETR